MGREIVYCEGCGTNLREPDFETGGARLLENKPYCAPCRPPEPDPAPPPRRSETTRARRASTSRIPLPPPAPRRPAARPGPKAPVLLAALALVGVAGLAFVLAPRRPTGKAAPPAPREEREIAAAVALPDPEREKAAHEARLREIDEAVKADPLFERSAEVFRLIEAARRPAGARIADLDRVRTAYEKSFEEAAGRLAEFARSEAGRLASQGKLDDAVRKCDEYLESFGPAAAAAPIRTLRGDLEHRRAR